VLKKQMVLTLVIHETVGIVGEARFRGKVESRSIGFIDTLWFVTGLSPPWPHDHGSGRGNSQTAQDTLFEKTASAHVCYDS
jgi:hypothetical protein